MSFFPVTRTAVPSSVNQVCPRSIRSRRSRCPPSRRPRCHPRRTLRHRLEPSISHAHRRRASRVVLRDGDVLDNYLGRLRSPQAARTGAAPDIFLVTSMWCREQVDADECASRVCGRRAAPLSESHLLDSIMFMFYGRILKGHIHITCISLHV